MTLSTSASAWWLTIAVPTWIIVLNGLVGIIALGLAVLFMLSVE